ncbi:MAG: hypothetical protein AAB354_03035 [candidate division KSB1 bacterium]
MSYDIVKLKEQHRRDLAKLSFDEKIAVLNRMQKIARAMARAAGRKFNGVVWGEREGVEAFLKMSDELAAESISAVDSAEDIRQLRDERLSRL